MVININVIILLVLIFLFKFVNVIVDLGSVVSREIIVNVFIYLYQLQVSGITGTAIYCLPSGFVNNVKSMYIT